MSIVTYIARPIVSPIVEPISGGNGGGGGGPPSNALITQTALPILTQSGGFITTQ